MCETNILKDTGQSALVGPLCRTNLGRLVVLSVLDASSGVLSMPVGVTEALIESAGNKRRVLQIVPRLTGEEETHRRGMVTHRRSWAPSDDLGFVTHSTASNGGSSGSLR